METCKVLKIFMNYEQPFIENDKFSKSEGEADGILKIFHNSKRN